MIRTKKNTFSISAFATTNKLLKNITKFHGYTLKASFIISLVQFSTFTVSQIYFKRAKKNKNLPTLAHTNAFFKYIYQAYKIRPVLKEHFFNLFFSCYSI